ncbi:MAG: hypothetical protein R2750_08185 [Bacteroidales bacterium]
MRFYIKKIFYFSIPFWIYVLFITVIDPYDFINVSHIIDDVNKISILNRSNESGPRGNMLWKAHHFKNNPSSIVLIGDSQGRRIRESLIEEVTGEQCFNFCVPGASYSTSIENFWFIAENAQLKKVYFVVSFMNYNANRDYSLCHFAFDYFEKPYKYFTTKEIFFDSWANFLYFLTNNKKIATNYYEFQGVEKLDELSKSQFNLFFGNYKYPENYYKEMKEIGTYCDENRIELTFILLPIYKEVNLFLSQSNLIDYCHKFKEDLLSIAPVLDYSDYPDIFDKRECFIDFYHLKQEPLDKITEKIWSDMNSD